jgi:ribosome-binding factor A
MSQRTRKVSESVKEIVAEEVLNLKDPRIGFLTVTDVRTSPDLKSSEVFWTVLPDVEEVRAATAAGLASAQSLLRRAVGQRLRLRHVPDLHFVHDPVPEQGRRIDRLLSEAAEPDREPYQG